MCVRACVRACVRVCVCVYLFVCPVRESSGCLTAAARAALPIPTSECIHCQCLDFFFFFPLRTDLVACDCTRGLYGHRRRVCTEN